MASNGRSVFKMIVNNFVKSLKLKQAKGKYAGGDHLGNSYYESPPDANSLRKNPIRWFVPKVAEDWQQNLPAEWEAWLRGRRNVPPTEEELNQNMAVAEMKKRKGAELELKAEQERIARLQEPAAKPKEGFPNYPDYEKEPGAHRDKQNT